MTTPCKFGSYFTLDASESSVRRNVRPLVRNIRLALEEARGMKQVDDPQFPCVILSSVDQLHFLCEDRYDGAMKKGMERFKAETGDEKAALTQHEGPPIDDSVLIKLQGKLQEIRDEFGFGYGANWLDMSLVKTLLKWTSPTDRFIEGSPADTKALGAELDEIYTHAIQTADAETFDKLGYEPAPEMLMRLQTVVQRWFRPTE